jgi:hypothetical protein
MNTRSDAFDGMKDEAEEGFRRMAKTKASCWLSEEK